jgi:hypothetical protein
MRPVLIALGLLTLTWPLAATPATTVAEVVFGAGLLGDVEEPATFNYAFTLSGEEVQPTFHSQAVMEVREVGPEGQKEVYFELFEGPQQRSFGPMQAKEQNPLILVFLQRDVSQMANLTGGSASYFQQQIRRAMNDPAKSEEIEIELDGERHPATRIGMRPFANDPQIAHFPKFRDKLYEFVVSDQVPGGLYQLTLSVPDPASGQTILAETLTFERVE